MKTVFLWTLSPFLILCTLSAVTLEPRERGPFPVEATNLEIAASHASLEPEQMDRYLIGAWDESSGAVFWDQILQHPDDAWIVEVTVPEDASLYESLAGESLSVVVYLMYPTVQENPRESYAFPHARLGATFEHMQREGQSPLISEQQAQYPLVILCHGIFAHSVYDVRHAEFLASQGYIVASISFGDGRISAENSMRVRSFLRPLEARSVLQAILDDPEFGPRVNPDQIGISGHSFGGFTVYTMMGARNDGEGKTVHDDRIAAGVAASPWTGGIQGDGEYLPFGPEHVEMRHIQKPVLTLFGSLDPVTQPKYIVGASRNVQGPAHLIELSGEEHNYSPGGWADMQQWELLFFDAYLKGDPQALQTLEQAESIRGGSDDRQHFDYRSQPLERIVTD
ncbi:MAG: hypothetical protein ABQ298_06680 [Puniceicoccaceae bacterium]